MYECFVTLLTGERQRNILKSAPYILKRPSFRFTDPVGFLQTKLAHHNTKLHINALFFMIYQKHAIILHEIYLSIQLDTI